MATYPAIDGVPVHASEKILTRILRDELGFQGLVLSEGGGITTLLYEGLAADQKQAGALALLAGMDVGISYESGYMQDMIANVQEGSVPMALIDRAVRHATHIIAVSEATKRDLVRLTGAPESKITVIYEAAESIYYPIHEQHVLSQVLRIRNRTRQAIRIAVDNRVVLRNEVGDIHLL